MKFVPTPIAGVMLVEPELHEDDRGFFARTYCEQEFTTHGLDPKINQCSISFNRRRGTLRGMHYQAPPHEEAKLVRVTRGAIYDVALDLRPGSASRRKWLAVELTDENRRALYIPGGVAHGFQTLADNTEVFYQISTPFVEAAARGVRFDDPALAIAWPLPVSALSERDRSYPLCPP